jgi:hypothetical protein
MHGGRDSGQGMLNATAIAVAIHLALPGVPNATANRYAADIAAVAETREEALLLVTVARHESSFDPRVERCEVKGSVGEITTYQLRADRMSPEQRERLCSSHRVAAKIARDRLARFLGKNGTVRNALMLYAGRTNPNDKRIEARVATFERLDREIEPDEE